MMTVSGFVEVVSRVFFREQTISELFSKEGEPPSKSAGVETSQEVFNVQTGLLAAKLR
jgi:hypothetical protein